MELHKIRGGTIENLESKKYTLSIGVSLGNKWFTVENILELIKWSLPLTKDEIVVYVGDSIHAINLEVKKKISFERALKLAHEMGNELLNQIKKEVSKTFSQEDMSKIKFARWEDLDNEIYKSKKEFLYRFYNSNKDFKDSLESIAKESVVNGKRTYSEKEINRLGMYIVEELPHQLNKIAINRIICDALVYPFDGKIPELVEAIQKGEIFPEIKEKIMDTEPKVFLEVR